MSGSTDLKSLDPMTLEGFLVSLDQPTYRARQMMRWMYQRDDPDPMDWTDLPSDLRERLAAETRVTMLEEVEHKKSPKDGTMKYLWRLPDGMTIEGVALFDDRRVTVCFSTQVGCALGCTFCATGRGGFIRNLSTAEIVDQVLRVKADLVENDVGTTRVSNAVAMGQGEPFQNYDAVLGALRLLNSPDGMGIGARHLTVSTCGIPKGIRRFAGESEQFGLAVSLHSARQEVRNRLMPSLASMPLTDLREALQSYVEASSRQVTLEYALIGDENDQAEDLDALVGFCKGLMVHVNLIPANPVADSGYRRSGRAAIKHFRDGLERAHIEVSMRAEHGADIDAACGQLAQRDRSWKKRP